MSSHETLRSSHGLHTLNRDSFFLLWFSADNNLDRSKFEYIYLRFNMYFGYYKY